jgi:hypothetical protein
MATATSSTHGNARTHGKGAQRTAKISTHGKGLCRAYMAERTAKFSLPFVTLPWALCRASTHGKGVAMRFLPFAVRAPRTAKTLFPVVIGLLGVSGSDWPIHLCLLQGWVGLILMREIK